MFLLRYGAGQLKVMFVGGPNVRKDYHIDEGEEVTQNKDYLTIRPVARKGYGLIAHEAKRNGLLTCGP